MFQFELEMVILAEFISSSVQNQNQKSILSIAVSFRQSISFKKNELDFGNGLTYDGTIWTPYHRPFTCFKLQTLHLSIITPCVSTLKGEERKWLIALIIRDTSHFRSCIKESNHPFSPFFTVSTLSSFSLLSSLSVSPCLSHQLQYDNIEAYQPCWGPTSCWSSFGTRAQAALDFVFHALRPLQPCDLCR